MSEKIYACLLRIFPSAFRRQYEEEALQLFRDRFSEERGFFRRLRLCFDLLADIISALPQAYRNSYAVVTPVAPLTNHFDGIPLFRVLQKEPLRPGAILLAGVFSFTTLATFSYVLNRSIPDRATPRGPMSPIESVIQRVNEPISPDSVDGVPSSVPGANSIGSGGTKTQPISATNASTQQAAAISAANLPDQSAKQNTNASYTDNRSSRAVEVPEATRNAALSATLSNQQKQIPAAEAVNFSGMWTGSFRAAGGSTDVPQLFILTQEGTKLTGTGGPNSSEQYAIIRGSVASNSVKFEMNSGQNRLLYGLQIAGTKLQGTLSIRSANGRRNAKVWLERAHER